MLNIHTVDPKTKFDTHLIDDILSYGATYSDQSGRLTLLKNLRSKMMVLQDKLFYVWFDPGKFFFLLLLFLFLGNHTILTCNQTKPAKYSDICLSVCVSICPSVCLVFLLVCFFFF